jgi:hypothetical protein
MPMAEELEVLLILHVSQSIWARHCAVEQECRTKTDNVHPWAKERLSNRRAWDAVAQVAPRSGGSADLACKCAPHKAEGRKRMAHSVLCSMKQKENRASALNAL